MNVINRWKTVPKELRDETMEHEYGWMIKYLLESCTVLVPPEAVRKNSLSHIEKSFLRWGNQFTVYEDYLKEGEQEGEIYL